MKIGILCGAAASAQSKARDYYNAIKEVGHEAIIFSRAPMALAYVVEPSIDGLTHLADATELDFYIGCTDALGDSITILNSVRGWPTIPLGATHKAKLGRLSDRLSAITTWNSVDEVPANVPIIVKPINGSGSKGGDPWAYAQYDSIDAFLKYMTNTFPEGIKRFEYAQNNIGVLGEYVFQEFIENDGYFYHHYMNDGTAKRWMETFCTGPADRYKTFNKFTDVDDFNFADNLPFGTFGSFQGFDANPLPYIFDFNVRCSAFWTTLHHVICPDFFTTYFDNLLNKKNGKYEYSCEEFIVDPDTTHNEGILIAVQDFPQSGTHAMHRIIMK